MAARDIVQELPAWRADLTLRELHQSFQERIRQIQELADDLSLNKTLDLNVNRITGLKDPVRGSDAVTLAYLRRNFQRVGIPVPVTTPIPIPSSDVLLFEHGPLTGDITIAAPVPDAAVGQTVEHHVYKTASTLWEATWNAVYKYLDGKQLPKNPATDSLTVVKYRAESPTDLRCTSYQSFYLV